MTPQTPFAAVKDTSVCLSPSSSSSSSLFSSLALSCRQPPLRRPIPSSKRNPTSKTAPEVLRGEPYTYSVDWFGLGVIMFEMLSGLVRQSLILSPFPFVAFVAFVAEMIPKSQNPFLGADFHETCRNIIHKPPNLSHPCFNRTSSDLLDKVLLLSLSRFPLSPIAGANAHTLCRLSCSKRVPLIASKTRPTSRNIPSSRVLTGQRLP